jgi:DNA-directed RNA polymerase subunit RPC12/RpoP
MFWILCGVAGGAMLSRFNKAGTGFLLGLLLGPIGLIIAWTMRDSAKLDDAKRSPPLVASSELRDERDCPYCAERILAKAKVCKHCGREVEPMVS